MTVDQQEAMVITGSRLLKDHRVVFAGVGAPLVASVLAQQLHAPHLTIILEGGYVGPRMMPGKLPISTNEMRACRRAFMLTGIVDVFLYAQRGYFDYGFVGGAQIDQFGNVNSSFIGTPERPKVRLPGTGGANDIVSSCREVFVLTTHERRRFVEKVDFITSPGYLDGGDSRERSGLLFSRPSKVVTDLAVMGFDPDSRRMRLEALQPGATLEDVVEKTGFELIIAPAMASIEPPTKQELEKLRTLQSGTAPPGAEISERVGSP